MGFHGSDGKKKPAWNAGDPGIISGSGISPGKGSGYPLQYFWCSALRVKKIVMAQEKKTTVQGHCARASTHQSGMGMTEGSAGPV